MAPEGLCGRRKMTVFLRRTAIPDPAAGAVDRAMRSLGLEGARRATEVRTAIPAADGERAGDLLDRDYTAPAPNRAWVTDCTCVRTGAGFVDVAFILTSTPSDRGRPGPSGVAPLQHNDASDPRIGPVRASALQVRGEPPPKRAAGEPSSIRRVRRSVPG